MLFWTLVGLGLFALLVCTILVIAMIRSTQDNEW
jgi:hypothetical protein